MVRSFLQIGLVAIVTCAFGAAAGAQQTTAPVLPPHPRLLLDRADVNALKQKVAGPFAKQWAAFVHEVDQRLAEPFELPPRGGNWSHNYVCPEHGARLRQGKKIGDWQWEHICPVGPHTLHGDPSKATTDFDGNAIMGAHLTYADDCTNMGVLYQMTGDARYAKRVREVLLAYADRYESYEMHDNQGRPGKGGRVASQSLTEASWLIPIAQGADLVWDMLSDDDRHAIETKLLRPALDEVILPHNYGIHNIQCRQNSAVGLVGLLVGDQKLIDIAIDDPKTGFRQQIAKGVMDDGMWTEGSSGYHFFTIGGLWPLAEAARHCGIDLYSKRYKSMFDAPIALAKPDGRLPNFNDSGNAELEPDAYELAYARWKDDAYVPVVARGKRGGRLALLYGVAELPAAKPQAAEFAPRQLDASGYAMLARGEGSDATWLCLKYGPHGGGHGHFDKNHFILYAHGNVLMPDAGTHAYGSPLHGGWDKHSLAHNTLIVDERTQSPAQGMCLAFGTTDGVDYAMTDAGPIYPDAQVRFVRTVAMLNPDLIVVIDQVRAGDGKEHTFDIAAHLTGTRDQRPEGKSWTDVPKDNGYPFLGEPMIAKTTGDVTLATKLADADRRTTIRLAGNAPTEIITATGIGETTEDRVPVALFRRRALVTTFAWVISLDAKSTAPQPELLHATGDADGAAAVVRIGATIVCANPGGAAVRVALPNGDSWQPDRSSPVAIRK